MDKKVVLISGGSDGLGKEIARLLAPSHSVVILSHNQDKTAATAAELGCDYVVADVADYSQVEKAVKQVIDNYQKIDVLINNAGIWIQGELETNAPEKIKAVLDVNTLGTIYLTRAALPYMKAIKSGKIINVISQGGQNVKPERSVYYASKWAITGFTKCLELELAPFGITVTGVYPGKIRTGMYEKAGVAKDLSDGADPVEVAKTITAELLV